MTYRLDPAVAVSDAVRQVALAELDAARAALTGSADPHNGVHSARKCLKRLRSLLMLIRPGLPEPVFLELSDRLRIIAKGLAPARDAQALIDALDKLSRGGPEAPPIQSLRGWLIKRRGAAERHLEGKAASDAIGGLGALRPAFAGLAIYPDSFRSIAEGLRLCYRATRKAFDHAFATEGDDDFHDWRKGVQHHWRQMQLLAPCCPGELTARVENARVLSQLLGDDHDIAMLRRLVSTPTMVFASPEATSEFLEDCADRHKALRREAKTRGAALFHERARPFAERIESQWLSAAGINPKPVIEKPVPESHAVEPRADNVVPFADLRTNRAS